MLSPRQSISKQPQMASIGLLVAAMYAALVLPPTTQIHDFPEGYLKHPPRYKVETWANGKGHLV